MELGLATDPARGDTQPAVSDETEFKPTTADACQGTDEPTCAGDCACDVKDVGTETSPCPSQSGTPREVKPTDPSGPLEEAKATTPRREEIEATQVDSGAEAASSSDDTEAAVTVTAPVESATNIPLMMERKAFDPATLYRRPIDQIPEFHPQRRQRRVLNLSPSLHNVEEPPPQRCREGEEDGISTSSEPGSTFSDTNNNVRTESTPHVPPPPSPLHIIPPLAHQAPYQLPQPIPPVIVGPHYVILFNQPNYGQIPPNLLPNFPFAELRSPAGPSHPAGCGYHVPAGCSGVGDYEYPSTFDPNFGYASIHGPQMIRHGQHPGYPTAMNPELPPLGTTFYPVPHQGHGSQSPAPEEPWTPAISYQVPVAGGGVEPGAAYVPPPTGHLNGRLNPHAPEYFPRQHQASQSQVSVNLDSSWSEQVEESHSSADENREEPQSSQEPRVSTAVYENTSRFGQGGRGRGYPRDYGDRYYSRGGRHWNNYDDDGRYHHDEREQDYDRGYGSYTYRGRGGRGRGRGRGGRGRGRGGRGNYAEEYPEPSHGLTAPKENPPPKSDHHN